MRDNERCLWRATPTLNCKICSSTAKPSALKTDSIFYRIFQSLPSTFFELINQPPSLASAYQFSSVEVKQLAFRIDGVFLPNTPELPIYFAEVQFQPDKKFIPVYSPKSLTILTKPN